MKRAKLTSLFILIALLAATMNVASQHRAVARSSQTRIEQKIDALLARMTLEEKLGQLQQLDGHADGKFRPEHLDLVRKGQLGSFLNVRGVKNTNAVQRVAVEETRLKIPALFGFDVIHGYRTIFPIPLGEHRGEGGVRSRTALDVCTDGGYRARPALGESCRRRGGRPILRRGDGSCARARVSGREL